MADDRDDGNNRESRGNPNLVPGSDYADALAAKARAEKKFKAVNANRDKASD